MCSSDLGECEIRITARAKDHDTGAAMCQETADKLRAILGEQVYDADVPGPAWTAVRLLREKHLTLATAESCTGGLVAEMLTQVPGTSEVFGFGYVTYWEQAKARMIGVDPAVIETYNVVSAPVAAQMAWGAKETAGADIGVGITGVAGPGGGDAERPVGTVYVALAMGETVWTRRLNLVSSTRQDVRMRAAVKVLDLIRRAAAGMEIPGTVWTAMQVQNPALHGE